jgi:hypothetical protein
VTVSLADLPQATQQQIAQQMGATTPDEIAEVLQQLQDDPDKLALIMKQLGIDESGWIDKAADAASGSSPSTPTDDAAASEGAVDDIAPSTNDVDDVDEASEQVPTLYPNVASAGLRYNEMAPDDSGVGGAPPDIGPPSSGGDPMASMKQPPADDIISADMMEQTTGNPNTKVPQARNMGKMQKPAVPMSKPGAGGGATDNRAMITQIYRQLAAKQGGKPPGQSPIVAGAGGGKRFK